MAGVAKALVSEEEVDRLAELDVVAEARDVVSSFEVILQRVRTGDIDGVAARHKLFQDASILRLKARTATIGGLGPITHRLEEYLAAIESIDAEKADDVQVFADRIADVLDGKWSEAREVAGVVRDLPSHCAFEVSDVEIAQVEITLVMPQRSAARVVERELAACGYRVSVVLDPFDSIGLINQTRPDLVITAQVMPQLSGVDLACALNAMPATRDIPVALLTSLERGHPDLAVLPMSAGLIRRGASFGEDLAEVLERFDIT